MIHYYQGGDKNNGESHMKIAVPAFAATASVALSLTCFANVASAVPMANALAMKSAVPTNVETVRWGGGIWRQRMGR